MAIIISSDHGEDLGEMGSYCEHGEADYITTHIPLIIKWPGCAKNTVSHGFHYNLDLLPTLRRSALYLQPGGWQSQPGGV